jgi:hypothetical protein
MTAAGGPHGADGSAWAHALCQPVPGTVQKGSAAEEAVAVAGSGGDSAFDGGRDADGVHYCAFRASLRLWRPSGLCAGGSGACVRLVSWGGRRGVVCRDVFS